MTTTGVALMSRAERVVVRVDRPMTDEEMIAAGNYTDPVESDFICPNSMDYGEPFVGEREMLVLRAEAFPNNGRISGRGGFELMKSMGLRPPTFRELFAFGAQPFPDKWLTDDSGQEFFGSASPWYMVIALNLRRRSSGGSSFPEHMFDKAPAIYSHERGRGLTWFPLYNLMIGAWPRNPWYLMVPEA